MITISHAQGRRPGQSGGFSQARAGMSRPSLKELKELASAAESVGRATALRRRQRPFGKPEWA